MQDYTRTAQIGGDGDVECRPLSFVSETNPERVLSVGFAYNNVITLTGSFPYTLTELLIPSFMSIVVTDNPATKIIEITLDGTPIEIGSATVNFLVNNCVGSEPADAYEYLSELEIV